MATKKLTKKQLDNRARKARLAQYDLDRNNNATVALFAALFVGVLTVGYAIANFTPVI